MADPSHHPGTGGGTGSGPDRGSDVYMPRWVKVFGIVALVLVLLFVAVMLTGRGYGHDPGRHAASGDAPPSVAEHDA